MIVIVISTNDVLLEDNLPSPDTLMVIFEKD